MPTPVWAVSHSWLGNLYRSGNWRLWEQNYEVCCACKEEDEGGREGNSSSHSTGGHASCYPSYSIPCSNGVNTFPTMSFYIPQLHKLMPRLAARITLHQLCWHHLPTFKHILYVHKHNPKGSWVLLERTQESASSASFYNQPLLSNAQHPMYVRICKFSCVLMFTPCEG